MKRWIRILLLLLLLLLPVTVVVEQDLPGKTATVLASGSEIKLTKAKISLYPGNTIQLKLIGTVKKAKWSSDHASVATVKNGKVTAVAPGKATIKASIGSRRYQCRVTVKKQLQVEEDGIYTEKDEVALYIHRFKKLPGNYITKEEATELGWQGGSLKDYAPGKSIGGDWFGNYEGLLPDADGRSYTECDIDTLGTDSRGEKRIVYSNDGLIYYTDDHYETFTLLYRGW